MRSFPACDDGGLFSVEPQAVLDRRMQKKGNKAVVYVLIQWANGNVADATQEPVDDILKRFLHFSLDT